MSDPDEITLVDEPNALRLLREAHRQLTTVLTYSAEIRNTGIKVMRLIEEVQDELRHGVDRALVPIRRDIEELKVDVAELKGKVA